MNKLRKDEMPQSLTAKTVTICTMLVMTATIAQADLVNVNNASNVLANIYEGSTATYLDDSGPLDASTSTTLNVSNGNGIQSTVNYNVLTSQTQYIFDFTTDHARTGMVNDGAGTLVGLYFTPTVNVSYTASGFYTALLGSGYSSLSFSLTDTTDLSVLFQSTLGSNGLASPYYTLGGMEGELPSFEGSLTGNLIAGREYIFQGYMSMQAVFGEDNGDTANGAIRFVLSTPTDPEAVPEPATFALFGIGSIGLLLQRRRQRA
ncbi:PEP-CTERM sorting domain-containing protein [Thalassoglobus sp. JC818]|uniref:PEP-CTERM sorting domain-containing protein n=1 Tax=Thalassoglobus sp. JC818 TaxID=3232136 RepID=UPI0034599821